uniref:Uncharacterized protein n=1 Tax=Palpitomonas bilix TaxID=652834 RepID=A0A7S3FX85_9EUKA|mmetsp:Transcript_10279/g.26936  ORF Transcript_10279/g.26936 Transcript_10279/m.26936 type:complete len:163 (+) Transcript_10279:131-619(+)|eukprot:CAMPEP_0113881368 /NCGR_PEP_ID=MMETSP0780_2-20120614/8336_1 /TAXON_ID=652834 /ORGANISM="Palpitomonas bilix" /LENGTH=162 /DNA_ID=CAMNT_0000868215 /DNA_START=27 /DNA_END=515 /DNA_ORIENTATION=+ /assembly_acc=CAM_ASM_000599
MAGSGESAWAKQQIASILGDNKDFEENTDLRKKLKGIGKKMARNSADSGKWTHDKFAEVNEDLRGTLKSKGGARSFSVNGGGISKRPQVRRLVAVIPRKAKSSSNKWVHDKFNETDIDLRSVISKGGKVGGKSRQKGGSGLTVTVVPGGSRKKRVVKGRGFE